MIFRSMILFTVLTLFGVSCMVIPKYSESHLVETDERLVENCQYIGSVTGTTDYGKSVGFYAKWQCKVDARRKAVRLGATHIVWLQVYKTSATALAYKCE